ncbi:hypothetical protein [Jidongwangia harbinensis]|uniref:hypothetical protein n=1 Tax=Jidongwangia harbinensis TaxID=2878561 RepID=UPI001CD9CD46|nr:hypothetical protein [Jidongwangia harbinensis]MCA2217781.1 hypothetical protein [Jidongwangia harbinensis]
MPRIDLRLLVLVPVLMSAAACGDDAEPADPPPSPVVSVAVPSEPPSAPPTSEPANRPTSKPASKPKPTDSVYVEEDEDPTPEAGDLPDESQAHLDEALGIELGALEGAPKATAGPRRAKLDKLPESPTQVLAALRDYPWYSPEARQAYDRAVKANR